MFVILQFRVRSHLVMVPLEQSRQSFRGNGLALREEVDKLSKQWGIALIAALSLTDRLRTGFE